MESSNSDLFQRKKRKTDFVLNGTLNMCVGDKRQELGSNRNGVKIGQHQGDQSLQFAEN